MIKDLIWSDIKEPNKKCCYTHVTAETPMGNFLITWKGWKKYDNPTIDETPWGEWFGFGDDLDDAKTMAEEEFKKRISECLK